MAEIRLPKLEQSHGKIKTVPIAVTPEGFWCCPSPVGFQKTSKSQNPLNKPKASSPAPSNACQKKQIPVTEKKQPPLAPVSKSNNVSGELRDDHSPDPAAAAAAESLAGVSAGVGDRAPRPKTENLTRKVSIEFGEPGTSDLKLMILGKQGFSVKLSVHRSVLIENSGYFSDRVSDHHLVFPCFEIDECEDVEIYVETVGLMYCKDLKQRLIKQSVSRVLRILKIAEQLGFASCIQSCLDYLEAVPWVGEEEEDKVVTSVLRLQGEGVGVTPVLKRVSSEVVKPPRDTLSEILELVLKSSEERGRREMKSIVLKLLKESNQFPSSSSGSMDMCNEIIYRSCRGCLDMLLSTFRQATDSEISNESKEAVLKQISLISDNLTWLLEILVDRQAADEFAVMWASQLELSDLHPKLPIVSRYHVSCITARLYVGIGKGELLPPKDIRHTLLTTWLQPLINDYNWLQHGSRSFDRRAVEEGIGRTILTLSLDEQQNILLGWLGTFLKAGDSCPNLQKAFEVWWRRTFVKPYMESVTLSQPDRDSSLILKVVEK